VCARQRDLSVTRDRETTPGLHLFDKIENLLVRCSRHYAFGINSQANSCTWSIAPWLQCRWSVKCSILCEERVRCADLRWARARRPTGLPLQRVGDA